MRGCCDKMISLLDELEQDAKALRNRYQLDPNAHPLSLVTPEEDARAQERMRDYRIAGAYVCNAAHQLRLPFSRLAQLTSTGACDFGEVRAELWAVRAVVFPLELEELTASQPLGTPAIVQGKAPKPHHSADFTFVNWFGTEYTFALGVQSSAVKTLWEEWERTGLGLHQDTIRNAIDAERDNFRMDTAFRSHPAFGKMIHPCGDGRYKLKPPITR